MWCASLLTFIPCGYDHSFPLLSICASKCVLFFEYLIFLQDRNASVQTVSAGDLWGTRKMLSML